MSDAIPVSPSYPGGKAYFVPDNGVKTVSQTLEFDPLLIIGDKPESKKINPWWILIAAGVGAYFMFRG